LSLETEPPSQNGFVTQFGVATQFWVMTQG